MSALRFDPPWRRPFLSIGVLLALGVLISLGTWQVMRLQWKEELISTVEARVNAAPIPLIDILSQDGEIPTYRPVSVETAPASDRRALVQGLYDGTPGWYVFTAQRITAGPRVGEIVLVNHGFVSDAATSAVADFTDQGAITGLARDWVAETGPFAAPPDLNAGRFYSRAGPPLANYLVPDAADEVITALMIDRNDNTAPGTMPLGGTTRIEFSNRHLGYAITWYGLAAGLVGVYLVMLRRRRERPAA